MAPIPIELMLAGRDLTEPRPSPDGTTVAFVARWGSEAAVVTVSTAGGPERIVTTTPPPAPGRGMFGGCFAWTPNGDAVVYAARDGQLWHQPVSGTAPSRITSVADGSRAEAPIVAPDGTYVVGVVDQAEVWRWSIDGTDARRVDDGAADFAFDPYVTPCGSTIGWVAWNVPDMPWDHSRLELVGAATGERRRGAPAGAIGQPGTLASGNDISVRDDTGWMNLWIGDGPLVDEPFEHAAPTWGMGQRSYAVSPDATRVAFTRNEAGFGRLCVVDVGSRDVIDVARGVHGQLGWSGDRLTALRSGARTPTQVVSYDTATWDRTVLAVGPPAGWDAYDLPEPELVRVEADGTTIHARRYAAGQGRVLCMVHGGPTDQWQVEFLPRVAFWWSRGWDVVVPDPRGSTGHGRAYQQALAGGWGRLDVDDTAAVIRHAHRSGWATPSTTAITGGSSGGLAALGVAGLHPGLVARVAVAYPVTDLSVLAAESHRFEAHYTISLVGPFDDAARYHARSPLSYADRIDVPMLVLHGDADPVVPLASTVAFVERARRAGREVELVVFDGEGHGFRAPDNKRRELDLMHQFLAR